MRILVVQEADWVEVGPHQSHHLMERLSKRGHEIIVIDHEFRWKKHGIINIFSQRKIILDYRKVIIGGGVKIIRPPFIHIPVLDYMSLLYTHRKEIQRQIIEFKPNLIIGLGILNANIAIHLAHRYHIPFFYFIIDEIHRLVPERLFQIVARYIESQNMRSADLVISINEGLRDYTIKMGANSKKTEVIRAGVDLNVFNPIDRTIIREKYGIAEDETLLFFMGWLYEFSGLKEVALELTKIPDKKIKLLVLGKGELWDTLQNILHTSGMESIIMEPWVPYQDVPKYIMAADICILPAYKNEIMMNIVPIKMYEYMAAGKPVIATRLSGLVKEFGEGNGVLYADSSEDVLEIAMEIIKLNRQKSIGEMAKDFVTPLDWNHLTDDFFNILHNYSMK